MLMVFEFKNSSPNPRSSRFSHMLSSRSFIILHFICRSIIHFVLIFMISIWSVSRFFFFFFCIWKWKWRCSVVSDSLQPHGLHMSVQFPQHHLLKILSCLVWIALIKNRLTVFVQIYFWALYLGPLICACCCTISHCVDHYSFILILR